MKKITDKVDRILVNEGEVFWCRFGLNIGNEEDGKGENFRRPVLVLKKFSNEIFLGVPLTTKNKFGTWYFNFNCIDGIQRQAILSQAKTFDVKRLEEQMFSVGNETKLNILNQYIDLINGKLKNNKLNPKD